ncbi:MAG: hypothetical protein K0S34_2244 [Bacillales bacterium]|nr:hypothetical protein [Bacillales bacterium]
MLEEYEEKLGLFHKFQNRKNIISQLKVCLENHKLTVNTEIKGLLEELEKLD